MGWLRYYGVRAERGHAELVERMASATPSVARPSGEDWLWLAGKAREMGLDVAPVELVPRGGTDDDGAGDAA